ncbi:hypothetical protein LIER_16833 [Lithospermum erythrorhizon]|uniref:Uncharacterized protein n=1 Tax=Lithospermum erythrorhizon TaxID=34254 RepID=A0AAV3Q850_LITER
MANWFEGKEHFNLPEEFLSFEDILMDNNFKKQSQTTEVCFPSEFPFEYDNARRLSHFPNSTLNHSPHTIASKNYEKRLAHFGGSPNATSPMGSMRESWDLIYQAAAEIANLKLEKVDLSLSNGRKIIHDHHSLQSSRNSSAFYNAFVQRVREEQLLKLKQQRCIWSNNHAQNTQQQNRVAGSAIGLYNEKEVAAWRCLQSVRLQNQRNRTTFRDGFVNGGSGDHFAGGSKKQSSGTGVFLPRTYGTNTSHGIKKPGCLTTPILDKGISGLRNHFNVMDAGVVQPPVQTRLPDGFHSDYDIQLAKMKLLLMQRRRHIQQPGGYGGEISIPQEWTY